MSTEPLRKLALIVGGGPAPGINGVISAVTIEAINHGIKVFGVMDGFKWLINQDTSNAASLREKGLIRELKIDDVKNIHLRGGSILRTSRANPTKSEEDMQRVLNIFHQLELDALVTIGGDDTAYSGSQVYAAYKNNHDYLRTAHVPKTIDNDLPLHKSMPTFGFETARQVGTQIVRQLAEDARTTSRWYVVVSMGRAAGHLALGIGKAAAATLTMIPEEFNSRHLTLNELRDIILGSMIKRRSMGRRHGVVMLAEGLLGRIGAETLKQEMGKDLEKYGSIETDPHGHLRLGEIDFGRMVKDLLKKELASLHLETTFVDKEIGYELRCADPIPFDAEYTRDLGYGAVKFLRSEHSMRSGAIISYVEGRMEPLPFEDLIDKETKRMKTRIVNIEGEGYECARRYMIRLDKTDFDDEGRLKKLADVVKMSPEQFRERFEYLLNPQ